MAVTSPRIVVSGATTAITRRTTLRKAFLSPWHPLVPQVYLYCLAEAQRRTEVAVHHGICVINHHHATVTAAHDNLPEFNGLLHHDLSHALNHLLTRERYDCPSEVFDGRSTHTMRLLDAAAQASQLVYEHNNCVAAGLVARPQQMPGYGFDFELWKTGYLEVERPAVYFSQERPAVARLLLTPPPLLMAAFGGDLDKLVYHLQRLSQAAGSALRAARKREPLGARRIERLHPWSEPRTLRERGGHSAPTFRIGARGFDGRQSRRAAATETWTFRQEHEEARKARRAGDFAQRFPYGTYGMRVLHDAPVVTGPKPGALVTLPGPLLSDIVAELETGSRPSGEQVLREQGFVVLEQVRNAFRDEATELCTQDELDFEHGGTATRGEPQGTHSDRADSNDGPVVTRHRFSPLSTEVPAGTARRVIVHRDRRRGRPPGTPNATGRRAADPPG